jgi:hypothetical protein
MCSLKNLDSLGPKIVNLKSNLWRYIEGRNNQNGIALLVLGPYRLVGRFDNSRQINMMCGPSKSTYLSMSSSHRTSKQN